MSTISISPWVQDKLRPGYDCRNGQLVSAWFTQRLAETANQAVFYRPKELFRAFVPPANIARFATWRAAAHTSPMAYAIVARVIMCQANLDAATNSSAVRMTIANTAGTTLATDTAYFGYADGQTVNGGPDDMGVATVALSATTFQDTDVRITVADADDSRLVACTVYEVPMPPDTDNGYVPQNYSVGQHIKSEDRSALQALAVAMYKRGAAPCFTYSTYTDAGARSNSQGVYRNVIDNVAVTGLSQHTPGFSVDLRYCNRRMSTTVPCRFEVYATQASGTGSVALYDSTGTALATHSITSSAGTWYQTTVNLPPTLQRLYIYQAGTGAASVTTLCASLYQYA